MRINQFFIFAFISLSSASEAVNKFEDLSENSLYSFLGVFSLLSGAQGNLLNVLSRVKSESAPSSHDSLKLSDEDYYRENGFEVDARFESGTAPDSHDSLTLSDRESDNENGAEGLHGSASFCYTRDQLVMPQCNAKSCRCPFDHSGINSQNSSPEIFKNTLTDGHSESSKGCSTEKNPEDKILIMKVENQLRATYLTRFAKRFAILERKFQSMSSIETEIAQLHSIRSRIYTDSINREVNAEEMDITTTFLERLGKVDSRLQDDINEYNQCNSDVDYIMDKLSFPEKEIGYREAYFFILKCRFELIEISALDVLRHLKSPACNSTEVAEEIISRVYEFILNAQNSSLERHDSEKQETMKQAKMTDLEEAIFQAQAELSKLYAKFFLACEQRCRLAVRLYIEQANDESMDAADFVNFEEDLLQGEIDHQILLIRDMKFELENIP